jgi:ParB family chromosome partitioning protein
VLSLANVRKLHSEASIADLADSIARRSLLQSLSVRAVPDDEGKESGTYEVQAGGRRLRALQLLVSQKRLAPDALIPCVIKSTGITEDDSLAENNDREALHPVDQFRAFAALRQRNLSDEDIAAAYGVTATVVRQRLKLAAASPVLLEAYINDGLSLDQLMAFCITDDQARQEQLWEAIQRGQHSQYPHAIRRSLTEASIESNDPRARFVGADTYVAAGGSITRDLFSSNGCAYFDDAALLNRLAHEKLEAKRQDMLELGWKWAEAAIDFPYNAAFGMRRLDPIETPQSKKEQQELDVLQAEYDAMREQYEDAEYCEQTSTRLEALEAAIHAITHRPPVFKKKDMARAGVMIDLDGDGRLNILYGLIKQEDLPIQPSDSNAETHDNISDNRMPDDDASPQQHEEPYDTTLPDRLVQDLTAFRTVALRHALASDFDAAFLAALHALTLRLFYPYGARSCLEIDTRTHFASSDADGLKDFSCALSLKTRHEQWQRRLPEDARWLWQALLRLPANDRADLFAHCVGMTTNAVREPHRRDPERQRHADQLAALLQLDMQQAGYQATATNYFGRITKARILEDVREAKGDRCAQLIEHLKKPDMAKEAARLVAETQWLPSVLRTGEPAPSSEPDEPADEHALPAFLEEPNAPTDEEAA